MHASAYSDAETTSRRVRLTITLRPNKVLFQTFRQLSWLMQYYPLGCCNGDMLIIFYILYRLLLNTGCLQINSTVYKSSHEESIGRHMFRNSLPLYCNETFLGTADFRVATSLSATSAGNDFFYFSKHLSSTQLTFFIYFNHFKKRSSSRIISSLKICWWVVNLRSSASFKILFSATGQGLHHIFDVFVGELKT